MSIKRGYELFRRLLFPAGLQNGWSGPGKGDLGRAIVNGYSRGFARPPLVVESDIDVDGTDPPVVYIHAWRPHSPDQLLFRRVVRDLWGQVLGYCPHGGGHWFFASPGERCCGSTGHWRQGRFVEHETDAAQPAALRPFPTDLVKRLWHALSDVDSWYARLEEVITNIGPIDDRFVDPPLLLSSRETLDAGLAAGLRPTEEGTLQRMREALLGQDAGDGVGRGWGLFDLLNRPVAQGAEAGLSWPRFIRHGHAFPAMRVLSDPTDYSCRRRYAPASLAQLILEVAAADAGESSLREADAELLWGPFWCARPGCPSLFISAELQRDERACATESGYRGLMFSQYCSHACFQADRGKMSGHLSSKR